MKKYITHFALLCAADGSDYGPVSGYAPNCRPRKTTRSNRRSGNDCGLRGTKPLIAPLDRREPTTRAAAQMCNRSSSLGEDSDGEPTLESPTPKEVIGALGKCAASRPKTQVGPCQNVTADG